MIVVTLNTVLHISTTSFSDSFHLTGVLGVGLPRQACLLAVREPGQGGDVSCRTVSVLPHQRDQTGGVTRLPEERMVEKLNCTGSLGGVPH